MKVNKLQSKVGYCVMRPQTVTLQYSKFGLLKMSVEDLSYLHKTWVLYPELSTFILKSWITQRPE
jgi:hypothetical protein